MLFSSDTPYKMDCRVIYFPFFQKKGEKGKKGKIREDRRKIMVNKGRIMDKERKFKNGEK